MKFTNRQIIILVSVLFKLMKSCKATPKDKKLYEEVMYMVRDIGDLHTTGHFKMDQHILDMKEGTLTLKNMEKLYKKAQNPDNDYPMIVGKIEVMKKYQGSKKDFMKALSFQLKTLKADMISEYKRIYE